VNITEPMEQELISIVEVNSPVKEDLSPSKEDILSTNEHSMSPVIEELTPSNEEANITKPMDQELISIMEINASIKENLTPSIEEVNITEPMEQELISIVEINSPVKVDLSSSKEDILSINESIPPVKEEITQSIEEANITEPTENEVITTTEINASVKEDLSPSKEDILTVNEIAELIEDKEIVTSLKEEIIPEITAEPNEKTQPQAFEIKIEGESRAFYNDLKGHFAQNIGKLLGENSLFSIDENAIRYQFGHIYIPGFAKRSPDFDSVIKFRATVEEALKHQVTASIHVNTNLY